MMRRGVGEEGRTRKGGGREMSHNYTRQQIVHEL